ncbi:hypothetical protein [Clostridium tyrobutyricum]|uniref:hypothetical protein n=1 Tax=Clostridium tyrobutyricum TaxID=1519 RepID=UPI0020CBD647|nr:hypothetical protein [Clostridium tyrobutyricum]
MIIERTDKFKREYKKLPNNIKESFKKQFARFVEYPYAEFHPSLRIKRIQGTNDIFEMTITMSIRVTWQYIDDRILLRNIGRHDKTLGNP